MDVQLYHDSESKEHLLVYSRIILWTDNGRYSEVNSGIQLIFTRPIIFYYSHNIFKTIILFS